MEFLRAFYMGDTVAIELMDHRWQVSDPQGTVTVNLFSNPTPSVARFLDLIKEESPLVTQITDGKFPSILFERGAWEYRIFCALVDKPQLTICGLPFDVNAMNMEAFEHHLKFCYKIDAMRMRLALHAQKDGWQISEAEWKRMNEDSLYMQYRLDGNTEFLIPFESLMEKFHLTKRKLVSSFLAAENAWDWRTSMFEQLWTMWTKKHANAYNRLRVVYTLGERREFRLRDEFPDLESLDNDSITITTVLLDTPEILIGVMARRAAHDCAKVQPAFPQPREWIHDQWGDVWIAELTTPSELEEEGDYMEHCVGNGSYYEAITDNRCRIFACEIRGERFTVALCPRNDGTWYVSEMNAAEDDSVEDETQEAFMDIMRGLMPRWVRVQPVDIDIRFEDAE